MTSLPDKTSSILQLKLGEYAPVSSDEKPDRNGWVKYGDSNTFPNYLIDLADSTPVHGALCRSIAEMIAGKGLTGNVQPRIDELNLSALLPKISSDLKKQGGFFLEVIYALAADKTIISAVKFLPFTTCRIGINEDTEEINGVWYSRDWTNTRKERNKPRFLPLFDPSKKDLEPNQVVYAFEPTDGATYYPKPDYWSAANDIETARQLGLYDVNSLANGMFPSFIIHMKNGIPPVEQQQETRRKWEQLLTGAKNTGKWVMTFNESGVDNTPEIEAFPMNEANTSYLEQLDKRSTARIFIGHRVTTPRLFGVGDTGSGLSSNTDEMKTGLKIFISQVIEPKQRMICGAFDKILSAEGQEVTTEITPNTPIEILEAPVQPAPVEMSLEKKKSAPIELADELISLGQDVDEDWIFIDSYNEDELKLAVSTGTARPNSVSEQDKIIDGKKLIARYEYVGFIGENSRPFCKKMVAAKKLYRKEDIIAMADRPVNPGWGPKGADTYPIWEFKGGGDCGHHWETRIFVSAKGMGIDVNSPNAQEIAKSKAAELGYKIRNNAKVATPPYLMPNRGFLPSNPKA